MFDNVLNFDYFKAKFKYILIIVFLAFAKFDRLSIIFLNFTLYKIVLDKSIDLIPKFCTLTRFDNYFLEHML